MEANFSRHRLAIEHLPSFITAPGETDVLLGFVVVFMVVAILVAGVLYMRLHALPEHLAHRTQKVQFEIVAVLALIALFTHSRIFWIAALLLAMIELPDFLSPLRSMAASLGKMAGGLVATPAPAEVVTASEPDKTEPVEESIQASETTEKVVGPPEDDPGNDASATSREGAN